MTLSDEKESKAPTLVVVRSVTLAAGGDSDDDRR